MKKCNFSKQCLEKVIRIGGISVFIFVLLIAIPRTGITRDYPEKPINLLSPYAVGGPVDLTARSIADIAKDTLPQPIIVIDKPGGGGIIAQTLVAKEKPDGYNLAITSNIAFVQVPQMREVSSLRNFRGRLRCKHLSALFY